MRLWDLSPGNRGLVSKRLLSPIYNNTHKHNKHTHTNTHTHTHTHTHIHTHGGLALSVSCLSYSIKIIGQWREKLSNVTARQKVMVEKWPQWRTGNRSCGAKPRQHQGSHSSDQSESRIPFGFSANNAVRIQLIGLCFYFCLRMCLSTVKGWETLMAFSQPSGVLRLWEWERRWEWA